MSVFGVLAFQSKNNPPPLLGFPPHTHTTHNHAQPAIMAGCVWQHLFPRSAAHIFFFDIKVSKPHNTTPHNYHTLNHIPMAQPPPFTSLFIGLALSEWIHFCLHPRGVDQVSTASLPLVPESGREACSGPNHSPLSHFPIPNHPTKP